MGAHDPRNTQLDANICYEENHILLLLLLLLLFFYYYPVLCR